jgi:mandelate racemase
MQPADGLTIRSLRARPLDLSLAAPVETAAGVMRTAPLVLVDLQTEEGVTGNAYVRSYTPVALGPLASLVQNLEALIRGRDADPAAIGDLLRRQFRLAGPQGLAGMAMAAIDMALWDVRARAAGVPLVRLLGGEPRPIPAYASLRTMSPRAAAVEAEQAVAALGVRGVKVKAGRGELAADVETVAAVREAVGDGVDIMVDYNQTLTVEDALERVGALDALGVAWIEEPTQAEDDAGHARIAAAARSPIQLGESHWGPEALGRSVAAGACDLLTLDAMKLGGVNGWLRGAAVAAEAGLPASSHTFPELSRHLLAVTATCHLLEYLDHAGPILVDPVRIADGLAPAPERPGSGVEFDEPLVARLLGA